MDVARAINLLYADVASTKSLPPDAVEGKSPAEVLYLLQQLCGKYKVSQAEMQMYLEDAPIMLSASMNKAAARAATQKAKEKKAVTTTATSTNGAPTGTGTSSASTTTSTTTGMGATKPYPTPYRYVTIRILRRQQRHLCVRVCVCMYLCVVRASNQSTGSNTSLPMRIPIHLTHSR